MKKGRRPAQPGIGMEWDEWQSVVMDCGTFMTRAGHGGDDAPRSCNPALVGVPFSQGETGVRRRRVVGDEVYTYRGPPPLNIMRPLCRGVVQCLDEMQHLLHHTFYNELSVVPSEHPLVLLDSGGYPNPQHENLAELLFDHFQVPALALLPAAWAAVLSTGQLTSVAVDCGFEGCSVVPVVEGIVQTSAVRSISVGGNDIDALLDSLLAEKIRAERNAGHFRQSVFDENPFLFRDKFMPSLKRETCRVPTLAESRSSAARELRHAPEVLFNPTSPEASRHAQFGLHEVVMDSLRLCDCETRPNLAKCVQLFGGTSCIDGLAKRLQEELDELCRRSSSSKAFPVNVVQNSHPEERVFGPWIGGSLLSSMYPNFGLCWVTKPEVEEQGLNVIRRKRVW